MSEAVRQDNSTAQFAKRFATGLVTGNADDVASLSGTIAGDLFVFGDIRDMVREGKHLAMGEETDHLILGLATVGLAVTAATYVSVGGAAPLRAGLTLVKDTRRVGRLSEGLCNLPGVPPARLSMRRCCRRRSLNGSVLRPGETIGAMKAAFRAEKAGALVRLAKDVGRIGEKAGIKAAQDTLKIAESPKEVARAAQLAGGQGRQDPRLSESVWPQRLARRDLAVDARELAVQPRDGAAHLPRLDQGHHGAADLCLAAAQEGAPGSEACGRAKWRAGPCAVSRLGCAAFTRFHYAILRNCDAEFPPRRR